MTQTANNQYAEGGSGERGRLQTYDNRPTLTPKPKPQHFSVIYVSSKNNYIIRKYKCVLFVSNATYLCVRVSVHEYERGVLHFIYNNNNNNNNNNLFVKKLHDTYWKDRIALKY